MGNPLRPPGPDMLDFAAEIQSAELRSQRVESF